jgi:cytochrome P450
MSFAMQEAVIVLANFLRAFRFALVDGQTVAPRQRVTLRPQNGLKMHARRRFSAR